MFVVAEGDVELTVAGTIVEDAEYLAMLKPVWSPSILSGVDGNPRGVA